jgi:hypothetical protein
MKAIYEKWAQAPNFIHMDEDNWLCEEVLSFIILFLIIIDSTAISEN